MVIFHRGYNILWMVAKSCVSLYGWNPIIIGINHLSTGAGFRNHPQYVQYISMIIMMIMIIMILIIIEDVPPFTVIEWDMYDDFCYSPMEFWGADKVNKHVCKIYVRDTVHWPLKDLMIYWSDWIYRSHRVKLLDVPSPISINPSMGHPEKSPKTSTEVCPMVSVSPPGKSPASGARWPSCDWVDGKGFRRFQASKSHGNPAGDFHGFHTWSSSQNVVNPGNHPQVICIGDGLSIPKW